MLRINKIAVCVSICLFFLVHIVAHSNTNRVLTLDGDGDYVRLPSNIFNNLEEATVEFWAKWQSFNFFSKVFSYGRMEQVMEIINDWESPHLRFLIYDKNHAPYYLHVDDVLNLSRWCHIAAISGPRGLKLYFNGELVAKMSYTGSFFAIQNGENNLIGGNVWGLSGRNNSAPTWHGQIDELRVWNHDRTQQEIKSNMTRILTGKEQGLVGYWNFDNGGDEVKDLTGNNNHGVLYDDAKVVDSKISLEDMYSEVLSDRLSRRELGRGKWKNYRYTDGLADNQVNTIYQSKDGMLWIGTGNGLCGYNGSTFTTLNMADGLADNQVNTIYQFRDGMLWIGTKDGLSHFKKNIVNYTTKDGLLSDEVHRVYRSRSGKLWIIYNYRLGKGLSVYSEGNFKEITTKDGLGGDSISQIYEAKNGILWILHGGYGGGVSQFDGRDFISYTAKDGLFGNQVYDVYETRDGMLWFQGGRRGLDGAQSLGISIYNGKKFTRISMQEISPEIKKAILYESKEGHMWVGTNAGVLEYDGQTFTLFTVADGLADNDVQRIYEAQSGVIWFLTEKGLTSYNGRKFKTFTMEDGLISQNISSILTSKEGHMWVATNAGVLEYDGQTFTLFTVADGLADNDVQRIYEAQSGVIWFLTEKGLTSYNGRKFKTFTMEDGLASNQVLNIYETESGIIWITTNTQGISFYNGSAWSSLDTRDGLVDNSIKQVVDNGDNVWLISGKGITQYQQLSTLPVVKINSIKTNMIYNDLSSVSVIPVLTRELVSFEVESIDFTTIRAKKRYRYRITELGDWGPLTRKTIYENKFEKSGVYTFEVQAIDRDLNLSNSESLTLKVNIPWYLNGWIMFPSGSSILVILILAIVNSIRHYRQQRESERLEVEAQQLRDQMLEQERGTRLALEAELADANQMQMSLLPEVAPVVEGLQIAGSSIATKEVGGDFFDYLISEDGLQISIAVGDVSGKGLRGAMNAVMASGILQLSSKHQVEPDKVMSEVNVSLCQKMEQDMNVTMVLAQFDTRGKQMTLANAGQHAYPLLIRGGSVQSVKAKGLALGMIPSISYESTTIDLELGDLLLLMTDGITEPRNTEGVMYEESGRLNEVLSSIPADMPIEGVVDTIINDVEAYTADEEQDDDITLVAVRVS